MEISDIVYLAFATLVIIVVLHIGVFWVSRMIQPPKPKIVYVDRPVTPEATPIQSIPPPPPPPPAAIPPQSVQTVNIPQYEMPPPIVQSKKADLPPPIETRDTTRVGFAGESK
jgi:hypothetical protein